MFLTITQIVNVTNTPQLTCKLIIIIFLVNLFHCCIIDISSYVIAVSISVSITAVMTVIVTTVITLIITYYCCIKSKGGNSSSTTGPPVIYDTPVSTSGASSLEVKDNMAYGHVTIDTSGNIHNGTIVYDNIII